MKTELKDAMKVLIKELITDESYRISWQANIAMAFKDEFYRTNPDFKDTSEYELHIIANKSADSFLNSLCS
jgi:hypothetical protein|tara:strand:- start:392 stop:604 length:213 start_codon:yes stop_codon:yes gene_type:complete